MYTNTYDIHLQFKNFSSSKPNKPGDFDIWNVPLCQQSMVHGPTVHFPLYTVHCLLYGLYPF